MAKRKAAPAVAGRAAPRAGSEIEPAKAAGAKPRPWLAVAAVASLAVFLLIYIGRFDQVVGLFVDDAWYVLLAKALATGQGYTMINSPSPGILPLYPPAFSALLSLVFRVAPEFPQNVWLLKSVSVAAVFGIGLLAYLYFWRDRGLSRWVALGAALATVMVPGFAFLATSSVMSECVFAFTQLLTVVVIERGVRAGRGAWLWTLLGGAAASFTFLTRAAALGLLAAVVIYLLKERLWRQAAVFAGMVALIAGPWMLYSRAHAPTPEQQREQGGHIIQPYTVQFWQMRAGLHSSSRVTARDLPDRAWRNLREVAGRDVRGVIAPVTAEGQNTPGFGGKISFLSYLLSLVVLLGFIAAARRRVTLAELVVPLSLLIVCLWPWETFRFVLPLAPFLIFYFVMGVEALQRWLQKLRQVDSPRARAAGMLLAAWGVAACGVVSNARYIYEASDPARADRVPWLRAFKDNREMFDWVQAKLAPEWAIASENPPLVYLFTGHKTVSPEEPGNRWELWDRLGVRYLVHSAVQPVPNPGLDEGRYQTVYRDPESGLNLRITDFGPPSARVPWGRSAQPLMKIENIN